MPKIKPEELKASILQYAIEGKLVEQRAEEGTAEELYKQIQAEKQKLVKEGKIKKEKPLPEISEDEIPFDIPESWKWCRCQDIFFAHSSLRIHQSDWKTEGIPFLRGRELVRIAKTGDPNAEIFITEEFYNELKEKGGVPKKDDILVSAVGTLGKVYVVKGTQKFYYKDAYILCLDNYGVDPYYIKYFIESPNCQNYIYGDDAYGTTVAQLTLIKLKKMILPLPPLAEQHRIVAKIEELLPYVDRYAEAYERLEEFNAKFPEEMKKSILQYAIEGRLVEQRAEEGTAEELYKQIQSEKQKLIKEGKIKKEKPLPEITEDEIPFDIPESWKWVRLGTVIKEVIVPQRDKPPFSTTGIPWCRIEDRDGYLLNGSKSNQLVSDETIQKMNLKVIPIGSVLSACTGGSIGTIVINTVECCTNQTFNALVCSSGVFNKYLFYYLMTRFYELRRVGTGTTIAYVSQQKSKEMVFPLPPLAEQRRIVAKIEELLPKLEALIPRC